MVTDNQLIQQCLEGNENAFGKLVMRYQNKMFSVCLSILRTPNEAQEAAQDTFIKAYKSLSKYNAESKFSSWLYKIAYRTSLDYLRKRKVSTDIDSVEFSIKDNNCSSSELLENEELTVQINKALSFLNPDEAGIIRMFYLEELSIKELEEITGLNNSNVKVKLFRARKKLSEIIKRQFTSMQEYLIE